jgi:predicted lipoprotein with Yx(FWY)xxD motif
VASTTTSSSSSGGAYGGGAYGGGAYGSAGTKTSTSASGTSTGSSAVMVTTKRTKLGTVLVAGSKQLTVYLFEGDKGSTSNCSGACATAWPPVTPSVSPAAGGQATAADLGTITRSDGTKQVTYKGHPLYYFVRDKASGDVFGQGVKAFGASWHVLAPTGQKVDNS